MKVSRRIVLRGIGGATLALPWLESVHAPTAKAQDAAGVDPFVIFFRQGNGCQQAEGDEPDRFWPTSTGALSAQTVAGKGLEPLVPYLSKLLTIEGVNTVYTGPSNDCGHAAGGLALLTAQGRTDSLNGEASLAAGESLDHRIGRQLNPGGRDSLALLAYGSSYLEYVLTYSGPGVRRSPITSPWIAYQNVVGEGGGMSNEALELLGKRRMSVNDLVRGQLTRFLANKKLSASDRRRLELHQSNVRDLEMSLSCGGDDATASMIEDGSAGAENGDGDTVVRIAKLHMDVAALAVACGYTRSVAIQLGNGNDGTRYRINGETYDPFHHISHRIHGDGSDGDPIPNADEKHHEVDKYIANIFLYLVKKLDDYELPDGKKLLDHGMAIWTNDLAAGPGHGLNNIPWVIAGSANGYLKQGQHIDAGGVGNNKLLNTIGAAVGLKNGGGQELDDFGAGGLPKGHISQIKA